MAEQLKIHFTHTEEGEIAPYKSTFGFNPKVKPYDGLTGSITIPIWNTYEGMKFDGSYKIRDHHDVAHLMKALESKSVELGFAVHVNDKQEAMIQERYWIQLLFLLDLSCTTVKKYTWFITTHLEI
jgi:hypothetical protein